MCGVATAPGKVEIYMKSKVSSVMNLKLHEIHAAGNIIIITWLEPHFLPLSQFSILCIYGALQVLLILCNGCCMWWDAWFGAASLTIATVSVSAHEGNLRHRIIIMKISSSCINPVKHQVSNGGAHLAADWWWSTDMDLKINIRINQCDCTSATGNSKLDTVSSNEDGRSCVRK